MLITMFITLKQLFINKELLMIVIRQKIYNFVDVLIVQYGKAV